MGGPRRFLICLWIPEVSTSFSPGNTRARPRTSSRKVRRILVLFANIATPASLADTVPKRARPGRAFSWGWLRLGIALLYLTLGVWPGLISAAAHAVFYVFILAPLINGRGHWRGAQNFKNTAYNSPLLAWVTGGESLHNNHHAHPRAPKFSVRRFEFDPSWLVIRALAAVKLVVITGPLVRFSDI